MSQEIIDYLNGLSHTYDAIEAAQVTSYSVYFGNREILVTVRDMGEGAGAVRYMARAEWAENDPNESPGKYYSQGNAAATLQAALDGVHWWEFGVSDD